MSVGDFDVIVTAIQAVVVAVLVFLGNRGVAKLSQRAKSDETKVSSQSEATRAWQDYAQKMEQRLDRLERRFSDAEARHQEDRERIQRLEREQTRDLDLVRRLLTGLRWALNQVSNFDVEIPAHHASAVVYAEDRLSTERKEDTR